MNLIKSLDPKLDQSIDELAQCVQPIVKHIEAQFATTQNHYGEYMTAIGVIAEKTGVEGKAALITIGIAMKRAGGNSLGIMSALKAMGALS